MPTFAGMPFATISFASDLPFVAGGCAAILAIGAIARGRRAVANWAFAAGLLVLAAEAIFMGLIFRGPRLAAEMIRWQQWRLIDLSFVPGIWLLFSLNYARGESRSFLKKWRPLLALAFLLPAGVSLFFVKNLVSEIILNKANSHWEIRLGWAGVAHVHFRDDQFRFGAHEPRAHL